MAGCSDAAFVGKQSDKSFAQARDVLLNEVFPGHGYTFYLGCAWRQQKITDVDKCLGSDFESAQSDYRYLKRSFRTEVEHIVPASWLFLKDGIPRRCFIESRADKSISSREHCLKTDEEYARAHNDLMNLRVVVGMVNAQRGNNPFVDYLPELAIKESYTQAPKNMQMGVRGVSLDPSLRGDVARIIFYMIDTYGATLPESEIDLAALYRDWDREDPEDLNENHLKWKILHAKKRNYLK
jgi:deoxyribonuclease-1